MYLNAVKAAGGHEPEERRDLVTQTSPKEVRVRELKALASIVDFAIYSAESAHAHEALAYLRNVADIVKADLASALK